MKVGGAVKPKMTRVSIPKHMVKDFKLLAGTQYLEEIRSVLRTYIRKELSHRYGAVDLTKMSKRRAKELGYLT
jgi:hypothetical protein